ncbi:MAG: LytR C-terminal domain-containing protein [Beutenbergiaceae bacterium]
MTPEYPYPKDEFDHLGNDRTPQGVHRAPVPRWRQWLPFLIVLVLAPTLAFLAVRVVSTGTPTGQPTTAESTAVETTEPAPEPETSEPEPEPETSEPEPEPTPTPEPTPEPTEPPAGDLDYSTQIWVLNGAGVGGLAADTGAVLTEAGWEDVNPADYGRDQPTITTLYYDNPDQADEAQAVADDLAIDQLVESSEAADGDIVIVLRSDFTLP